MTPKAEGSSSVSTLVHILLRSSRRLRSGANLPVLFFVCDAADVHMVSANSRLRRTAQSIVREYNLSRGTHFAIDELLVQEGDDFRAIPRLHRDPES